MAERHALLNPVLVRFIDSAGPAQRTAAFRFLGLHQVPFARAGAQHFAGGRNLKTLGRGLFGLNTFWTSHRISFLSKKSAQYRSWQRLKQAVF
jgi:hypothetical protein